LHFRILGPLEVISAERGRIDIPRPRYRALLCVLLLHPGEPVSRQAVCDAMWGPALPGAPEAGLRNCVCGLRKALGDDGRLRTRRKGYVFQLAEGDTLDLSQFGILEEQARAALVAGDYHKTILLLQQALRQWREPVLEDFPTAALNFGEAASLLERKVHAQEIIADARLALGENATLVPWLREMVATAPMRERRWEQLMLAQYRAGMRADALASYRQAHQVLANGCGIAPGPGLGDLRRRISVDDRALAWQPGDRLPAAPAVWATG
jgi:DNA-binding SARP family transcriptional activator